MIGFLNDLASDQWPPVLAAFRKGLGEAGYIEGQNVAFSYRWTEGRRDRLAALAADLVRSNVAVIITSGDTAAALAAQAATSKIPIIFAIEDDPIRFGLAADLDKPGGNATGIRLLGHVLARYTDIAGSVILVLGASTPRGTWESAMKAAATGSTSPTHDAGNFAFSSAR